MSYKVVVSIPHDSGNVKDTVSNQFIFGGGEDASEAELQTLCDAVHTFYNTIPPTGTTALRQYMSEALSSVANTVSIKVYDLDGHLSGTPHGSPVFTDLRTLAFAGSGTPLPDEVAMCITIEGIGRSEALVETTDGVDVGTAVDRPRQRRTGRIYLGPLQSNALDLGGGSGVRPAAVLRTDCRLAMDNLATLIPTAVGSDMFLGVWSRADATIYQLEAISTDDALDTQRRRGLQPTARSRLTI